MKNHEKDRHVVAAAVRGGAKFIVTFNEKDFPAEVLLPLGLERQGPSVFLRNLYGLAPDIVVQRLAEQAGTTQQSLEDLLRDLQVNVPDFVRGFCEDRRIVLR